MECLSDRTREDEKNKKRKKDNFKFKPTTKILRRPDAHNIVTCGLKHRE